MKGWQLNLHFLTHLQPANQYSNSKVPYIIAVHFHMAFLLSKETLQIYYYFSFSLELFNFYKLKYN